MSSTEYDEAKETGAHYTPHGLARFLARRLLDRLPGDAVASVDVLDPACGDGQLLEAVVRRMGPERLDSSRIAGIDTDTDALEQARRRLDDFIEASNGWFRAADFLDVDTDAPESRSRVLDEAFPGDDAPFRPDVIIANPPYVRTQVMGAERSRRLASAFGLEGRLDLYQAFLVNMTAHLESGGLLGAIVSNKFLTTEGAGALREFLLEHLEILELVDLGDTRLFDAAVLPAVLVARKTADSAPAGGRLIEGRFVRAYQSQALEHDIGETDRVRSLNSSEALLDVESSGRYGVDETTYSVVAGSLRIPPRPRKPWSILSRDETDWLRRVDEAAATRLGRLCDIHVGIKTNADEVFVRDNWSELPEDRRPEDELLYPLLTGSSGRWTRGERPGDGLQVLYPHRDVDGSCEPVELEDYPRAQRYLRDHEDRLRERTYLLEAGRRWYEHWVPHRPARWSRPKIVFPDIATEPTACFDDQSIVKGSCYWLSPDDESVLYKLLGLLNSSVVDRYHDLAFQNRLYAGRRRYLTQYVEKYPVPPLEDPAMERVGELVRSLVTEAPENDELRNLERAVDRAVRAGFGL